MYFLFDQAIQPTAPRSLTSRERFLAALSNPEPDRIPIDLSGHPVQQSAIVEEDVLHLEL